MNPRQYSRLETPISPAPLSEAAPNEAPLPPAAAPWRLANYGQIIFAVVATMFFLRFADQIGKAVILFLAAFLIAVVLNAPVRFLEKRGVKRGISAAGVALIALGGLGVGLYLAVPPLANEAVQLAQSAPARADRLRAQADKYAERYPALRSVVRSDALQAENLAGRASSILPRLGRVTLGLLGGLTSGFFVFVIALYTLGAPQSLVRGVIAAVPPVYRRPATRAFTRIVGQLEAWAVATLLLMLIVGTLCGIGLFFLRVPNAVLFGVLAAIGEGIPTIGPILSAVPPVLVSLADDPNKALQVGILFLVVQQIENNILVPLIMGRSLKLHPVSILFFVLALGAILGVAGALLAVPAAIIIKVLFEEFYLKRRNPASSALDAAAAQIIRAGSRPSKASAPRTANVTSMQKGN